MLWNEANASRARQEPVCIIGAGPSGLITAHVLLKDGFQNVQIISRDPSVGGVWSKERVYPTMRLNNVHGQFRFSPLPMLAPSDASSTGGRLRGKDLNVYLEHFYEQFLVEEKPSNGPWKSIVRFNTEVLQVRRGPDSQGWSLLVKDTLSDATETLYFPRIVLCTGGCSTLKYPVDLSPTDALNAGFKAPVFHSSQVWTSMDSIIASAEISANTENGPRNSGNTTATSSGDDVGQDSGSPPILATPRDLMDAQSPKKRRTIVVIGGGKSAQDIASEFASKNVDVTMVYNKLDVILASPKPLPPKIRQSRALSVLWPSAVLNTRLEKFFHTTWVGNKILKWFWNRLNEQSFQTYSIPKDSPLRLTHSFFWDARNGDDGLRRDDSFPSYVMKGKINIVAPARVVKFVAGEGDSQGAVLLSTGEKIEAAAVICASGYTSSWDAIFDEETVLDTGLIQVVDPKELEQFSWDYLSIQDPPKTSIDKTAPIRAPGLYRGLVPANSIERRDIAINGAIFSANSGYSSEVSAHWISAYFLGEQMRLPESVKDAKHEVLEHLAWVRQRYPNMGWSNPSFASHVAFLSWPQLSDSLLEDMYLPSMRSGGNWLNWFLQPVDSDELQTLGEERRKKRGELVIAH